MTPELNEEFVLTKCKFFASTQIWPLRNKLDPDGWLSNFEQADRRMALQLLNSFMYFSDDLLDRMFVSAIQGLSRIVTTNHASVSQRTTEWWSFLNDAIVTFPTGEKPFVGDSGHLFVRRARDLVGIEEERILPPEKALSLARTGQCSAVVFVDDFVGTGLQFSKTWNREYRDASESFNSLMQSQSFRAFYCPVFCTRYAIENALLSVRNNVHICPAHWLTDRHSVFSDDSVWWPEALKPHVHEFISKYSSQIGLPDTGGYDTRDWQGFHQLGLSIAFRHCCPDATIPLFDTTEGGWTPLWRR